MKKSAMFCLVIVLAVTSFARPLEMLVFEGKMTALDINESKSVKPRAEASEKNPSKGRIKSDIKIIKNSASFLLIPDGLFGKERGSLIVYSAGHISTPQEAFLLVRGYESEYKKGAAAFAFETEDLGVVSLHGKFTNSKMGALTSFALKGVGVMFIDGAPVASLEAQLRYNRTLSLASYDNEFAVVEFLAKKTGLSEKEVAKTLYSEPR